MTENSDVFRCVTLYLPLIVFFSDISQEMAINSYDIVSTLQALGMMKYWKGKHIILKKQVCLILNPDFSVQMRTSTATSNKCTRLLHLWYKYASVFELNHAIKKF